MVVIDEAYAEFANLSVVRSVHNTPNLVVLRSFSKAYGMAGNRVGYMVASPQVINNTLYILDTQWDSVSYLSVGAALTALDHKEYYEKMRDNLLKIKKTFEEFLKDHNFTVLPSLINSALLAFKTEESAQQFVEYLKEKGIVVNHGNGVSNIGLDKTFVRIAIGTEQDMAEVKKCIENKYTLLSA
jgi:histidinol-phosphate aminotransferase